MAIKTFLNKNTQELDREVNEFMGSKGKDLPVRTEVFKVEKEIFHKATVFYDEIKRESIKEEKPTKHSYEENKIGVAWKNKKNSATLNVKLDENPNYIFYNKKDFQKEGDDLIITNPATNVNYRFKPNLKKSNDKHPDWIIYQEEEEKEND